MNNTITLFHNMILGIDPGTATVGYAFCKGDKKRPNVVDYGVITTEARADEYMPMRLIEIADDLEHLLKKHKPDKCIIEDLFFFKNSKTVISVAQSRGMMVYLLAKHGVEVESATPLQIKQTLCGYGRASKAQVQTMIKKHLGFKEIPKPDDAADALAMAWYGLK